MLRNRRNLMNACVACGALRAVNGKWVRTLARDRQVARLLAADEVAIVLRAESDSGRPVVRAVRGWNRDRLRENRRFAVQRHQQAGSLRGDLQGMEDGRVETHEPWRCGDVSSIVEVLDFHLTGAV